jgi:p-aminobenzoyl-glutamate transporter AbgT
MFFYGLGTGATMLCAQYYGKGEYEPIRVVIGFAMKITLIASIVFAVSAFFKPDLMMLIFTNDKELIEKISVFFKDIGGLVVTIFFFVQFISVFKKTNIGVIISCWGADLINNLSFNGILLIILTLFVISFSGIFLTSVVSKWTIFSPVVVPLMMQSNISPEFAQFVLRAADSMSKGITPFLGYFVIYLGYLNIYNNDKEPITIKIGDEIYIQPYYFSRIFKKLTGKSPRGFRDGKKGQPV